MRLRKNYDKSDAAITKPLATSNQITVSFLYKARIKEPKIHKQQIEESEIFCIKDLRPGQYAIFLSNFYTIAVYIHCF